MYDVGYSAGKLKWAAVFSIAVHILLILLIFYIPLDKKETAAPFITRLVTPEELQREFPLTESSVRKAPPAAARRQRPSSPVVVPRAEAPSMPPQASLPPSRGVQPSEPAPEKGPGAETSRESTGGPGAQVHPGATTHHGMLPHPGFIVPPKRPDIFDSEVIGKIAKREDGTHGRHDDGVTFDTREFKYQGYLRKLRDKIESVWRYPHDAAQRGKQGDVEIRFTIKKNGELSDIERLTTTGDPELDAAAIQALKDGQRYWPLPDEWGRDSFTITGHFVYSLYGTPHIR